MDKMDPTDTIVYLDAGEEVHAWVYTDDSPCTSDGDLARLLELDFCCPGIDNIPSTYQKPTTATTDVIPCTFPEHVGTTA